MAVCEEQVHGPESVTKAQGEKTGDKSGLIARTRISEPLDVRSFSE